MRAHVAWVLVAAGACTLGDPYDGSYSPINVVVITPEGATFTTVDERVTLIAPPDAVSEPTAVTIDTGGVAVVVSAEPPFERPVTLRFPVAGQPPSSAGSQSFPQQTLTRSEGGVTEVVPAGGSYYGPNSFFVVGATRETGTFSITVHETVAPFAYCGCDISACPNCCENTDCNSCAQGCIDDQCPDVPFKCDSCMVQCCAGEAATLSAIEGEGVCHCNRGTLELGLALETCLAECALDATVKSCGG